MYQYQGPAKTVHQLQNKFKISVLGLKKMSVVKVSMAKTANLTVKMLLFQVLLAENTR